MVKRQLLFAVWHLAGMMLLTLEDADNHCVMKVLTESFYNTLKPLSVSKEYSFHGFEHL